MSSIALISSINVEIIELALYHLKRISEQICHEREKTSSPHIHTLNFCIPEAVRIIFYSIKMVNNLIMIKECFHLLPERRLVNITELKLGLFCVVYYSTRPVLFLPL